METTRNHAACPEGCCPCDLYGNPVDTPFLYSANICDIAAFAEPGTYELGVLAYPDGTPSNRWQDGVAGIPKELWQALEDWSELPACIECGEGAEWQEVEAT
ncbi:hypothetical protein LCGC14_1613000 [marine sediment metagenome]|uniref:Uncharacterized protein n=1 Tax=marine sediment metagenome TaxID=412755 RepID=A0A0F9I802_9ZZZZ